MLIGEENAHSGTFGYRLGCNGDAIDKVLLMVVGIHCIDCNAD